MSEHTPKETRESPLSFNCTNGCGACGVRLVDFVTHATQAQDGDDWITVASEPQIVSTCCGSPVEVWDDRKDSDVGKVFVSERDSLRAVNAELLEALTEVFSIGDRLVPDVYGGELVHKARAAIASARKQENPHG